MADHLLNPAAATGEPAFPLVLGLDTFGDRTSRPPPAATGEPAFPLVLGLDPCGDRTSSPSGEPLSHAQTVRNVVEQGVLAEQAGVDFFGIGEHHTDYF